MKAKFVALVVVIFVVLAGWFFVSPLFIDEVVDEALVGDSLPTPAQVREMPAQQRKALMTELMQQAQSGPDQVVSDKPVPQPIALRNGRFSDADAIHKGTGTATIYRLDDGAQVLRFEDFRVTNGPALVVLLSRAAAPASASDVEQAGYISLGRLKGNVGNQNYAIPPATDVEEFGSVVIWCELFDVLFSPAPLSAT